MHLDWLEDFLALAETRNFSRAAAIRHVTQPAFSRRIRALEAWIGAPLVERRARGMVLNAAGLSLQARAGELLRELRLAREAARNAAGQGSALAIAATHALSFTFFPGWIRARAKLGTLRLISDTMAACERILMAGEADFLLCHVCPGVPTGLAAALFESVVIGTDQLVAVAAADDTGAPLHRLPAPAGQAVKMLAYSEASGLGRILAATLPGRGVAGDPVFTAPFAATLQSMARDGLGIAFLPRTMLGEDVAAGRLTEAGPGFAIAVEIRLFRPRRRRTATAEAFWHAIPPAPA
ncbi:MAG: LysR family transcriptional regulator [Rhodospirillales bacterium]|nr:LysR family transcriptional regulator [Rhodospirillales bacterium]